MEQVSPTRMNMLISKRQIAVAEQGAGLLRNKKDALMKEFMELIVPLLRQRRQLDGDTKAALASLALALGLDGAEMLESAAYASEGEVEVQIEVKKVWGVTLPTLKTKDVRRTTLERGYAPVSVSGRVDATAEDFEALLEGILRMIPTEVKLKKVGLEIRNTSRRVNALEQKLIPQLQAQVRIIAQTLEDREREDKFRLKRLKAKAEKES